MPSAAMTNRLRIVIAEELARLRDTLRPMPQSTKHLNDCFGPAASGWRRRHLKAMKRSNKYSNSSTALRSFFESESLCLLVTRERSDASNLRLGTPVLATDLALPRVATWVDSRHRGLSINAVQWEASPVAVPDRGRNFMGATCAAPPELTARRPSCTDEEGFLLKSLLEWHRWFAWYPVPVVRKGKLRYAWLRFVERKWGTSRYSGTMKWRYRLPTRSRMR